MSFFTSLTGLNAATAQLGVTSNNIANASTVGFKRSRADFGDIFATSPLQKASATIGQGVSLKGVTQEFGQGNLIFKELRNLGYLDKINQYIRSKQDQRLSL
jgi:flagellar hook-basal body protein